MKNSIVRFFAMAVLSLFAFTACNSSESAEVKPEVVANASTELAIEGMMCVKGCVGAITSSLKKTHGVGEFEIFFEEGRALINYDSEQISEEEIIAKIHSIADGAYKAYPFENVSDEAGEVLEEELLEEVE